MTHTVIFEKKVGDKWQPTPSSEVKTGDTIRMREEDGTILGGESKVAAKNAVDPDSRVSFNLGLDYLGG